MSLEVIAEIAQGYEGDFKLAELLTMGAIQSGADSIKFQLVYADELAVPSYEYYGLFKSLEMKVEQWGSIISLAHKHQRKLYFDIYGELSCNQAKDLGADGVKISTADFYNTTLVEKSIELFDKVFISVAGVEVEELDSFLEKYENQTNIIFMYGLQSEPTPLSESNLRKLTAYKNRYNHIPIGFMDHSSGDTKDAFYLPLMALASGVDYIEKHITLDRKLQIEDYISALSIDNFSIFIEDINRLKESLGDGKLVVSKSEKKYKSVSGKVVVANRDIEIGEVVVSKDLSLKRVDTNEFSPFFRKISDVNGMVCAHKILKNQGVSKEDLCKEN